MRRKGIYVIQIALSLVLMCGLATSCAMPSSTTTPPASEYPADISGRVTIADILKARDKSDTLELTPLEGKVFWIVDISVKNKAYENAVTASYKDWAIVAGDEVYQAPRPFGGISTSSETSVPGGETGKATFWFAVPNTLKVNSAKLCYRGQEPYSYGKLSLADKVAVYDWDLKEVVEEPRYVPVSPPAEYECPKPHGLYSAITLVGEETAEFKNDEFIRFNPAVGKFVYIYRILDGCTKIELTDVVTGDIEVYDFKYSEEYGYVVIDGWSTYWKE